MRASAEAGSAAPTSGIVGWPWASRAAIHKAPRRSGLDGLRAAPVPPEGLPRALTASPRSGSLVKSRADSPKPPTCRDSRSAHPRAGNNDLARGALEGHTDTARVRTFSRDADSIRRVPRPAHGDGGPPGLRSPSRGGVGTDHSGAPMGPAEPLASIVESWRTVAVVSPGYVEGRARPVVNAPPSRAGAERVHAACSVAPASSW